MVKLNKKDVEQLKIKLIKLREHLLSAVEREQNFAKTNNPLKESRDEGDFGQGTLDMEIEVSSLESLQNILQLVERALRKIEKGTYGICEQCRRPINKARLEALPYATLCMECQKSS
ncbi:TraR/DksA family transcriptional regulator [Atrimonas thermophila]|jgi:RNA polymerase-binding protein DksA